MLEPTAQKGLHEGRTTGAVRITGMAQDAQEAVLSDRAAGSAVMGMVDKPLMSGVVMDVPRVNQCNQHIDDQESDRG